MVINENYKIETDRDANYMILEAFEKKDGTIDFKVKAYLPNIKRAYKYLVDREVMKSELKDLETVINKIDKIKKDIDKINK